MMTEKSGRTMKNCNFADILRRVKTNRKAHQTYIAVTIAMLPSFLTQQKMLLASQVFPFLPGASVLCNPSRLFEMFSVHNQIKNNCLIFVD